MGSTHPYSSMEVDAPEEVIGLCSGSMEGYLHSSIQSSLDNDVSLHGDILQEDPQDLMCGDQGTIHVPLLERCETMESQGGDGEKNQHHELRSTHPYPFLGVIAPRREARLHSQGMGIIVHPYV